MTTVLEKEEDVAVPRTTSRWIAPIALAAILILAAVLYAWSLSSLGWANSFYSAAVKSMGRSFTNFVFGAYDPAGVITVDKPPAGLWPQVISTKIFGFHGWSLILPQVVEGVAAVFVLHRTVRRWAGEGAALVAALVLTLTPITVAINRDNNPDSLLLLSLIAAAYALTRAYESPRATWWLNAAGALIGLGFLTKMLAAWMVVPAFALAWLVGATRFRWWGRIWRLLVAGGVVLVTSLWWVAMDALWPGDHPYIGGSTDGSAWDLVIGYNGLGRVFGQGEGGGGGGGVSFGGASGFGRLFNDQVAGQISWLLPACAVALVVGLAIRRAYSPALSGWLLWGGWLVVCGAVFSAQEGIFHPYYTTQLAPAIAALVGGLVATVVRAGKAGARWAVPSAGVAVLGSAAWAFVVVNRNPSWNGWLRWALIGLAVVAVLALLAVALRRRGLIVALVASLAALLIAPAVWAFSVPGGTSAMGGANPSAGPASSGFGGGGGQGGRGGRGGFPGGMSLPGGMSFPGGGSLPSGGTSTGGTASAGTTGSGATNGSGSTGSGAANGGGTTANGANGGGSAGAFPGGGSFPGGGQMSGGFPGGSGGRGGMSFGGDSLTTEQKAILSYVVKNSGSAEIKLAVEGGANATSAYILNSDEIVIGMGGFLNSDDAPSVNQLRKWTTDGRLRFVLGSGSGQGGGFMMGGSDGPAAQRSTWIGANCTPVAASAYGGTEDSGTVLYDCAPKK